MSLIDKPTRTNVYVGLSNPSSRNQRAYLRNSTCSEGVGISRDQVEEAELLKNSKAGSPQIAAMRSR
jgi:hypothetical protein